MRLEKISSSVLPEYELATDENYLAAAFAFVLDWLLQTEPFVGLDILNQLCAHNNEFPLDTGEDIRVSAQAISEQGRPDIKVFSPGKLLIHMEVTLDSRLAPDQLARHKEALNLCSGDTRSVVLLTGFNFKDEENIPREVKHIWWFEVYNWLADARAKAQDPFNKYLMEQFMSVLEEKRLVIEKVESKYAEEVPASTKLINMIKVAIDDACLCSGPCNDLWCEGYYLPDGNSFFCRIYYDDPIGIEFNTEPPNKHKFDRERVKKPSYLVTVDNKGHIYFNFQLNKRFYSLDEKQRLEEITRLVETAHRAAVEPG